MEPHYRIHPGRGPFALFVHGILSGRSQWRINLEALARVCRPVVVELFGHGRSPAPVEAEPYHPDAYLEAFERLRRRLDAERWLLCGQSLGATLTLRYSLVHPERVLAQVFTNSNSALADDEWVEQMRVGVVAQAAAIEHEGMSLIESLPLHPRNAKQMPQTAREALLADAALLNPAGLARTLRYTVAESPLRHRVSANRVPTLLACGRFERSFIERRDFAADNMPCLEIVDLDAGHAVNIQAAGAFDAAVTGFFSRHSQD